MGKLIIWKTFLLFLSSSVSAFTFDAQPTCMTFNFPRERSMVSESPYVFKQWIYAMIWTSGIVSERSQFVSRLLYHPSLSSLLLSCPLQLISSFSYQNDFNFIVSMYLRAIIVDAHNDSKYCDAIIVFRINFKIL